MTVETIETVNTTRFQDGQAAGSITPSDARVLGDSLASMPISRTVTATTTALIGDRGSVVVMNTASANNFQIPTDATLNFDLGTVLTVFVQSTGVTTIVAVTPGTTSVVSLPGTFTSLGQRAFLRAWKLAANSWIAFGDLT